MFEFWIDVEGADGTRYGPGPITTATGWQHTSRLDGAGEFSFTMPASDPMSTHLANKRVVRCRGILDGAITELGLGIIDKISVTPGNPTMVTVSGPDIMAELVDRSVHSLVVCEQQWTDLSDANRGLLAWVRVNDNGVADGNTAIPKAHDGNDGTYATIYLMSDKAAYVEHAAYLYIGGDARWDRARILFAGGDYAEIAGRVLYSQYYNGDGWAEDTIVSDGTDDGGTFRKNGDIVFTRQPDWTRHNALEAGGDWFWRRLRVKRIWPDDPSWTGYFKLAEVDIYEDVPTADGVNKIMAYAPDTWTKTGYPATVSPKYLEFHGESVLEALLILSEQGGTDGSDAVREHFRYNPASPREVDWLGTTVTPSGVRAVAPVDAITAESASELVVIQNLTRVIDSAEVVTRIYPRTLDGITLALATVGAATGYTHNTASNYIQHTAGYNAYGLIERHVEFPELSLQQADSYTTHPTDLANQLHERATEFLRTHGVPNYFYQLSVLQFPALLMAGDTIECVYHEYTDGVHTVNIDTVAAGTPLHILAPTIQITSQGIATIGLEVATIDRAPKSDAGVIVDLVRQQKRSGVAASNLVTILGTVPPPPPGELGGWSIGDLAIENNDAVLHSDGWIQLGSGDNIIRMDAQDVGYRMWAGAPLGADAPFSITVDGNLHAENAYIEGEIVADTGAIGGFVIGADHVKDLADSFGLSSVVMGGDDVRFWAGDTFANRASAPFRVTKGGVLTASGAVISGTITATAGDIGGWQINAQSLSKADTILSSLGYLQLGVGDSVVRLDAQDATYRLWAGKASAGLAPFRVTKAGVLTASGAVIQGDITALTGSLGNLSVSGTLELVTGGIIESDNYAAGLAGWRVDHNGDAEFNNIYARGRIDTAVFQYDQISAVSGSLLVTPSAGALGAAYTTAGALTIEGAAWAFATGDVVRIRALDSAGAVKQVWVTVTRTGATNVYTTVKQSGDDATWPIGTAVLGYGTGGGSLMMTAADALDGPRYSVLTHGASPWMDEDEIGRFGLLDNWQTYLGTDYGIAIGDYAGGNYLLYGTTTGFVLKAGSGAVSLGGEGLVIGMAESDVFDQAHAITWTNAADNIIGTITAYEQEFTGNYWRDYLSIRLEGTDGRDNVFFISCDTIAGKRAAIEMTASSGGSALYAGGFATFSDDSLALGEKSGATVKGEKIYLIGDSYLDANANVILAGTIRESVPIHLRLSRRGSDQSIPDNAWTMRFFDTVEYGSSQAGIAKADLVWMHSPLTFTGSGLNDLTHLGQPTYPDTVTTQFAVKITSTGATDYFQWSVDGGSTWNGTNIAITGSSQSIGGTKDVRIQFGAKTGHTLNSRWSWEEYPRSKVIVKQAGLYSVTASATLQTGSGGTLPYRTALSIRRNGTSYQAAMAVPIAGTEVMSDMACSSLVWLAVNDFIESPIYHNYGQPKNLRAASDVYQSFNNLTIARVA